MHPDMLEKQANGENHSPECLEHNRVGRAAHDRMVQGLNGPGLTHLRVSPYRFKCVCGFTKALLGACDFVAEKAEKLGD